MGKRTNHSRAVSSSSTLAKSIMPRSATCWLVAACGCLGFVFGRHPDRLTSEQEAQFQSYQDNLNTVWVLESFIAVFLMQAGFALLEAGNVRVKNIRKIVLKNVVDAAVSGVSFYAVGYALAFGRKDDDELRFSGYYQFFLVDFDGFDYPSGYPFFCFMYAFAAASVTIVSGALAERTKYTAYVAYAAYHCSIVYPVVAHWVFSTDGWLSAYRSNAIGGVGFIDFAGSAVVHMVGGVAGFVGARVLGPRIGRFDPVSGKPKPLNSYSVSTTALGAFILWYGWFSFNAGSTLGVTGGRAQLAARVSANTSISAVFAAIIPLLYAVVFQSHNGFQKALNGMLSGLVAITGPCSVIDPYAAAITGCMAGIVYIIAPMVVLRVLRVDDPLDVVAVHGCSGMLGVLVPAFFAQPDLIEESFGVSVDSASAGIFYGGDGTLLGVQLFGSLCILMWTAVSAGIAFWFLSICGVLRMSVDAEMAGGDENAIQAANVSASVKLTRNGIVTTHRIQLS